MDGQDEVCECCENTCDVISQKQTGKWSRLPKWSVSRGKFLPRPHHANKWQYPVLCTVSTVFCFDHHVFQEAEEDIVSALDVTPTDRLLNV